MPADIHSVGFFYSRSWDELITWWWSMWCSI